MPVKGCGQCPPRRGYSQVFPGPVLVLEWAWLGRAISEREIDTCNKSLKSPPGSFSKSVD